MGGSKKYASEAEEVVRIKVPPCGVQDSDMECATFLLCGDSNLLYNHQWREAFKRNETLHPSNDDLACFPILQQQCKCTHSLETHSRRSAKGCACWCHEQVIDVTKTHAFPRFAKWHWLSKVKLFSRKPLAIEFDTIPTMKQENLKVAKTMVWYATFLYIQFHRLQQGQLPSANPFRSRQSVQYVVAHCRNGRSRSPNVILMFFYLFHFFSFSETEPGTRHGKTFMGFLGSEFQSQVLSCALTCLFFECIHCEMF
jgi:hypothetical protein